MAVRSGSAVCRICANGAGNVTYHAREMMFGLRERFAYFQCSRCGCLQISEFPGDMNPYYPPEYYSFSARSEPPAGGSLVRRIARRRRDRYAILGRGLFGRVLFRWRPDTVLEDWIAARFPGDGAREVGLSSSSRILDVGCGSGELLRFLHTAGFRSLLGVDRYVERDLLYPGGLRILKRSIHEIDGHWDLVMLHHSLEHMADQQETLEAVGRLLAPGGWCLIRVPIVSYAWEHYGVDWVQLDAPRHFFLHSAKSLKRVADRAGLEIARTVYDSGSFQFWGSELYRRDIPLGSMNPVDVEARAAAFKGDEMEIFEKRGQELNAQHRGDQAAFYLQKSKRGS